MPAAFDDLWIGQGASLGAGVISEEELNAFCKKMIVDKKLHDSVPFSPITMDSQIAR